MPKASTTNIDVFAGLHFDWDIQDIVVVVFIKILDISPTYIKRLPG
jgi:hypothetical protein